MAALVHHEFHLQADGVFLWIRLAVNCFDIPCYITCYLRFLRNATTDLTTNSGINRTRPTPYIYSLRLQPAVGPLAENTSHPIKLLGAWKTTRL